MCSFGVSVAPIQKFPVPHYRTETNRVCQIVGLLMKPTHVCLCVSVSFILNPDPKKNPAKPHKTINVEGGTQRARANEDKKDGDFFFLKCGSNGPMSLI